jgi:hypothetical protein
VLYDMVVVQLVLVHTVSVVVTSQSPVGSSSEELEEDDEVALLVDGVSVPLDVMVEGLDTVSGSASDVNVGPEVEVAVAVEAIVSAIVATVAKVLGITVDDVSAVVGSVAATVADDAGLSSGVVAAAAVLESCPVSGSARYNP